MENIRKSFIMYTSWARLLANLPTEQAGELIKVICAFQLEQEYISDDQTVNAMWAMIRPQMEEDAEKYKSKAKNNLKAAKARWASTREQEEYKASATATKIQKAADFQGDPDSESKNEMPDEIMHMHPEACECIEMQSKSIRMHGDNDNDNVNDNDNTKREIEKRKAEDRAGETDYQQVVDAYNATCVSLPRAVQMSDARKKAIKARLRTYTIADLQRAFELTEESNFLRGANDRNWAANFDWIMKDRNLAKILDGNYANRGYAMSASVKVSDDDDYHDFTVEEFDALMLGK